MVMTDLLPPLLYFPKTPSRLTIFLSTISALSRRPLAPSLLYEDSAFGLVALLILSLNFRVTYSRVIPPLLGLLFDPTSLSSPLLLLDPLPL